MDPLWELAGPGASAYDQFLADQLLLRAGKLTAAGGVWRQLGIISSAHQAHGAACSGSQSQQPVGAQPAQSAGTSGKKRKGGPHGAFMAERMNSGCAAFDPELAAAHRASKQQKREDLRAHAFPQLDQDHADQQQLRQWLEASSATQRQAVSRTQPRLYKLQAVLTATDLQTHTQQQVEQQLQHLASLPRGLVAQSVTSEHQQEPVLPLLLQPTLDAAAAAQSSSGAGDHSWLAEQAAKQGEELAAVLAQHQVDVVAASSSLELLLLALAHGSQTGSSDWEVPVIVEEPRSAGSSEGALRRVWLLDPLPKRALSLTHALEALGVAALAEHHPLLSSTKAQRQADSRPDGDHGASGGGHDSAEVAPSEAEQQQQQQPLPPQQQQQQQPEQEQPQPFATEEAAVEEDVWGQFQWNGQDPAAASAPAAAEPVSLPTSEEGAGAVMAADARSADDLITGSQHRSPEATRSSDEQTAHNRPQQRQEGLDASERTHHSSGHASTSSRLNVWSCAGLKLLTSCSSVHPACVCAGAVVPRSREAPLPDWPALRLRLQLHPASELLLASITLSPLAVSDITHLDLLEVEQQQQQQQQQQAGVPSITAPTPVAAAAAAPFARLMQHLSACQPGQYLLTASAGASDVRCYSAMQHEEEQVAAAPALPLASAAAQVGQVYDLHAAHAAGPQLLAAPQPETPATQSEELPDEPASYTTVQQPPPPSSLQHGQQQAPRHSKQQQQRPTSVQAVAAQVMAQLPQLSDRRAQRQLQRRITAIAAMPQREGAALQQQPGAGSFSMDSYAAGLAEELGDDDDVEVF